MPFGGVVLSTERLNRLGEFVREGAGGHATVGAGVVLADFQREARARGLSVPARPDGVELLRRRHNRDQRVGRAHVQVRADAEVRQAPEGRARDGRRD